MQFYNAQYSQFTQIWAPPQTDAPHPHLYVVLVPADVTELKYLKYLYLLEQRIQYLIDQSIAEFGIEETDYWLSRTIEKINPAQWYPVRKNLELDEWKMRWADTLVHYTDCLTVNAELHDEQFPSPVIGPNDPQYNDLKEIHDQVRLEAWLLDYLKPYP